MRFHLLKSIQSIFFNQNINLFKLFSCTGIHYIVRRVDCGLRGSNRQIGFIAKPSNSFPKARSLPLSNLANRILLVRSGQVGFIDKPSNYLSLPSLRTSFCYTGRFVKPGVKDSMDRRPEDRSHCRIEKNLIPVS